MGWLDSVDLSSSNTENISTSLLSFMGAPMIFYHNPGLCVNSYIIV